MEHQTRFSQNFLRRQQTDFPACSLQAEAQGLEHQSKETYIRGVHLSDHRSRLYGMFFHISGPARPLMKVPMSEYPQLPSCGQPL